jgi:hypothetical protein
MRDSVIGVGTNFNSACSSVVGNCARLETMTGKKRSQLPVQIRAAASSAGNFAFHYGTGRSTKGNFDRYGLVQILSALFFPFPLFSPKCIHERK